VLPWIAEQCSWIHSQNASYQQQHSVIGFHDAQSGKIASSSRANGDVDEF
jgi:hypothetical protein